MSSITRMGLAFALVGTVAVTVQAGEAFNPDVARRLTPEQVEARRAKGEKVVVIDTRTGVRDEKVKGAALVPNDRIEAWAKDVPKGALIVAYCT
jgi:hypothetical protein